MRGGCSQASVVVVYYHRCKPPRRTNGRKTYIVAVFLLPTQSGPRVEDDLGLAVIEDGSLHAEGAHALDEEGAVMVMMDLSCIPQAAAAWRERSLT